MNRKLVIDWLLEHRDYWNLSRFDLVPIMQQEGLLSRKTNIYDVNIGKLIDEAKIFCGEKKPPVFYGNIEHEHSCPECGISYECVTPECPYPEAYRCGRCFRFEPPIGGSPALCRFEERPLYCNECRSFIGELGTCEDHAICRNCEKTQYGTPREVKRKSDVIYSPEGGPRSQLKPARVNRV